MTSLFDLFKIGIGPSSSHTVGPMRAARRFITELDESGSLPQVNRVLAELFGSLALTGIGHGTDRAVLLGLMGEQADTVDLTTVDDRLAAVRSEHSIPLNHSRQIPFDEATDLVFHRDQMLAFHPNGMRFTAFNKAGEKLSSNTFYSIGGGFIVTEDEAGKDAAPSGGVAIPYPFHSGAQLLEIGEREGLTIWQIMLANESASRSETDVREGVMRLWQTMRDCTERGMRSEGILPGGLNVRRRAPRLVERLRTGGSSDPLAALDWVTVWAMAVNEENAAGGRVVTAPTNGAAGVVPAVAHYYRTFVPGADDEGLFRYFLTAAAIGILYKENASISGAEVGCQGEVGVACSMAAGGLVAAQDGSNFDVEHAAEIGMEHNLGMTCDPIGGLVQIPCIERNGMGAVKAVNACRMAMHESGGHKVSLDQVIATMYQTGLDMQSRYKETSLAGLALNVIEC